MAGTTCLNCKTPGVQKDADTWALTRINPGSGSGRPVPPGSVAGMLDFSVSLRVQANICPKCGFVHLFVIKPK